MILMPIVYVSDMERSIAFYERLGFSTDAKSRPGEWAELTGGGGILALHGGDRPVDPSPKVELCFLTTEPLEQLVEAFAQVGTDVPIVDEAFGRSARVTDPDGMQIQVNENDRALYT